MTREITGNGPDQDMQFVRSKTSLLSPPAIVTVVGLGLVTVLTATNFVTLTGGIVLAAFCAAAAYWLVSQAEPRRETKDAEIPAQSGATSDPETFEGLASLAIEQMPDPVILLTDKAQVIRANKAAAPYVGEGITGQHISSVVRTPAVLDAISSTQQDGNERSVDYSIFAPIERHLRVMVVPVHPSTAKSDENGQPVDSLLVTFRDLTAEKRTEQMRADFVANASHELRTPLSSLSGYIETLRGAAKEDAPAREKFLGIMQEQADRMRRLIEDLLSLSRIEMNEHVAPTDEIRLVDLVRNSITALSPVMLAQNVRIEMSFETRPLTDNDRAFADEILGDRDELIQVFQNLIDNAIKYGREQGAIHIDIGNGVPGTPTGPQRSDSDRSNVVELGKGRASSSSAVMYVSIRDEGEGIPKEHIPRLTERFYRVDSKSSIKKGSTGLGLAIVKHIVNRHRGWLTIDSQLGEGSTFTVYLPRRREAVLPGEAETSPRLVELNIDPAKSEAATNA